MSQNYETNRMCRLSFERMLGLVDVALFELLPEEVCRRHQLVPLGRSPNHLVVGCTHSLSELVAVELGLLSGLQVLPVQLRFEEADEESMVQEEAKPQPTPYRPSRGRQVARRPRPWVLPKCPPT